MPPRLLTSSRAHERLAIAARWLQDQPDHERISIVAPSLAAAGEVIRTALPTGAALNWHRDTLRTLARRIAAPELAERDLVVATPSARLAAVVHTLNLLTGKLVRLDRLVGLPGLPKAVLHTLTELRLAQLPAAHVPELLHNLFTTYHSVLQELQLADDATVLTIAAHVASPGRTLLVDVLPRWPAERELVRVVCSNNALAVAPVGGPLHHLASALAVMPQTLPSHTDSSLTRTQSSLFARSSGQALPLDSSVRVMSAQGEHRECVELARQMHHLAHEGVPFDQMAVVLRQPGRYYSHLVEAMDRAGIPAYFCGGVRQPEPSGRAFLVLLDCADKDIATDLLCEFLSLGQLDSAGVSPRWERTLATANIASGHHRYATRLQALRDEWLHRDPDAQAVAELDALTHSLLPLVDRLAALPPTATWAEWLTHLRQLAANTLRDDTVVQDALTQLAVLGDLGPVPLRDVTRTLETALGDRREPSHAHRFGRVWIGSCDDALGHAFSAVFVPGLTERQFPVLLREDPLLLDRLRADVPELPTVKDRASDERLALHIAVGAAVNTLHLSWPQTDAATGRPVVPSFYALEGVRAATAHLPSIAELQQHASTQGTASWPAPHQAEDAIDAAEHDLALLRPVVQGSSEAPGLAHYLLDTNPHLARALRTRARRWTVAKWTPADGLVAPRPPAHAVLQTFRLGQTSSSASSLERFAACPYQYFLHSIVGLRERPTWAAVEQLDPASRGTLHHAVLANTLNTLVAHNLLPLTSDTVSDALDYADRHLFTQANALRDRLAPTVPRVWQDTLDVIRTDIHAALHQLAADGVWTPTTADWNFAEDGAITVAGAKLTGAIDQLESDGAGQVRVTEIKTGAPHHKPGARVSGGRMLQPLLYSLAAAQQLPNEDVVGARVWFATRKHQFASHDVPLNDRSVALVRDVLDTIDRHVETGTLPAAPSPAACEHCPFTAVCGPHEELRVKSKQPLPSLARLRGLP
jgi:ATP-dependent helicase/nuclease subunit B